MNLREISFRIACTLFLSSHLYGGSYVVTTTASTGLGSLDEAVSDANDDPGSTITFDNAIAGGTIELSAPLVITSNCTIDGETNDITISGGTPASVRPFFISENLTSVVISNLTIVNGLAQGGAGGSAYLNSGGGGGGGGLGGGCLVDSVATFIDVSFQNNQAIGGVGGSAVTGFGSLGGGGGGGLGGDGGEGNGAYGAGGGGEFSDQPGQNGASASGPFGQALGGGTAGGNGGGYPEPFSEQGLPGNPGNRFGGGGGGSRTNNTNATNGGAGGVGGGGGGAGAVVEASEGVNRGGGNGGMGGGGGGSPNDTLQSSGSVQATSVFGGGLGGFEGGNSGVAQPGGGGAGLGGALFVSNQGDLTLAYTTSGAASAAFSGNTVQGGAAGITGGATDATAGSAVGTNIFVDEEGTVSFNISSGVTVQPATSSLASNTNGLCTLQNIGPGTLDLSAITAPLFAANVGANAGIIHITSDINLGEAAGTLSFDGGTLDVDGTFTSNRPVTLSSGNGVIQVTGAWTESSTITGTGGMTKTGTGSLFLSNAGNTYSGETTVSAGTLALIETGVISSSIGVTVDGTFDISALTGSSATINSLSGSGIVNLGSKTLLQNSMADTAFSGELTGMEGSFTKLGSDYTLTLTGTTNNYTGNTTIAAGTLAAGAVQALSPYSAVILSGGTLALDGFDQSVPSLWGDSGIVDLGASTGTLTLTGASRTRFPYEGSIINAGNLTLAGSGVFRLTGTNNTYSGTTTINSGALRLGAHNALSQNSAIIMGGGLLDLNGFNATIPELSGNGVIAFRTLINPNTLTLNGNPATSPLIFSGSIKGRGNLTIDLNTGKIFQLTGLENTYKGVTTVNSGTLQTGSANALSSFSRVVMADLADALLDLNEFPNEIFSLSGGGSSGGNVALGSTTNGILTIGGNQTATYAGEISGNGGLTQQGSGTTILTGVNTYTGSTIINAGTLVVGVGGIGSLTSSDVMVNSGGLLKGTGTISQSVTVGSGGTISGGNSIGTISLGDLTLLPGSNLTLEINDTGASTIYDVTNNAALAGTLVVTVNRGVYEGGTTYTFITTGPNGRMGTFDSVTSNTYGTTTLSGTLNYGSDFVELLLISSIYPIIPTTGLQGNAKALADYLNRFADDPALQPIILTIGALPTDEIETVLSSISPARNAISSWTVQNTLFGMNGVAMNRMLQQRYIRGIETNQPAFASLVEEELTASLCFNKPYGKTSTSAKEKNHYAVWAEGLGLFANQKARNQNPSFYSATGGGLVGFDAYDFTYGQIGAALGYAQSSVHESGTGSGSIQSYVAGIYGTTYIENAYVELGFWGAFDQFHNTRNVVYPGFNALAKSNHNGWQWAPHLGVGYDVNFCWGALEPFASFDAAGLFQNSYSETGVGILDMDVQSSTSWLLQSEVGINVYQVKQCTLGYLIFRETLSYVNLAPFAVGTLSGVSLVGYPPGFTVTSFNENLNMISPGFEVFFKSANNGFFLSLAYDGQFTIGPSGYMSNEGIAKIGKFF